MSFPGVLLVSVPPPPPVVDANPGRYALEMEWTDGNGTRWSLSDPDSGIILMQGVRGLGAPTFTHFRDDLSGTDGALWRGYRAEVREVFWPVYLYHDGNSADWVTRNRAFWRGMSPSKEGTWSVRQEDGTTRRLRLRYMNGAEEALDLDPVFFGWAKYGIYLQADQPYWEGDPVTRRWETAEPEFFFGPDDEAPPFYIAKPPVPAVTTITNPGDVAAWPVWRLTGPLTSATLTVDGRAISVPFALGSGDTLVIDTRPTAQTAILNGTTDMTGQLGSYGFAKIPPGVDREISVLLNPPSDEVASVEIALTPLYEWGF